MKVYTITCHDVYNVGASLQAYALMTYLESLGHDVEIIDYKPDYLSRHYRFDVVANPKYEKNIILKYSYLLAKFPERLINYFSPKKKIFDEFKNLYLNCTDKTFHSNDELKKYLPERDVYIAGSDQIWNTFFQNGKDPAFYLDFAPQDKIKVSYAASFATDKIFDIDESIITTRLKYLDFIAVRETSGLKLLDKLGINNGKVVLDPVFLLDKEYWQNFANKSPIKIQEGYLLIYDFDQNEKIKNIALAVARQNNWKIYSLFKCDYADKCFVNAGPIDFLKLINNANYIISNSFHATAFSVIFNKQFIVVNRHEGINTRMRDFLTLLNIHNNMHKDYLLINKNLEIEIENSKKYIDLIFKGDN